MGQSNIEVKLVKQVQDEETLSGMNKDGYYLVKNDTVDYLGRRANKKTTGGWLTGPLIFGSEMCERISANGVAFNLVPYLVLKLYVSKSRAATVLSTLSGFAYLTPLLGGFIADTWLGRYRTIIAFGTLQFSALILLTLFASISVLSSPSCTSLPDGTSHCEPVHGVNLAIFYGALGLMTLGSGGIKACVSPFGADQFDRNDPKENNLMGHFFNWFYFSISGGALFAVTVIVYIEDKVSYILGYGITALSMFIALVGFASGWRLYRYSPIQGSPFTRAVYVLSAAYKNRHLRLPSDPVTVLYEKSGALDDKIEHTDQFLFLSKAAIVSDMRVLRDKWPEHSTSVINTIKKEYEIYDGSSLNMPLAMSDKLGEKYGAVDELDAKKWNETVDNITVTEVEEMKALIRLFPISFTTFFFWTVDIQMVTFSVSQAIVMDRQLWKNVEMAPANAIVMLQLSIMTMVVVYDQGLVPILRYFTGRPRGLTMLQRIGVGLCLSCLAMVVSGFVEARRRDASQQLGSQISIFWLIPQFLLVGCGESFTYIGLLEFFYHESPRSMRSVGMSLCMCTMAAGFFMSSFLVGLVVKYTSTDDGDDGWLQNNLDLGHLDRFYWMLAILGAINICFFLVVASWYNYRHKLDDKKGKDALLQ